MFKLCTVAAISAVLVGSASAGANLEYGHQYEEAYLASCIRGNSAEACACSMDALEEKVGFTHFAEEVDRYGLDFLEDSSLAVLANDLVAWCEDGVYASE